METTHEATTEPADKPLILVVEDSDINAEVIRLFLRQHYRVDWADNGETALKLIREHTYEAILLDIHLGMGMDGLELTRILRADPCYLHLPIIAITGFTLNEEQVLIMQSGCDHCLSKPFTKAELTEAIARVLS